VGVLLELNCETDFVARNEVVEQLTKDLCMQVAAASPLAVSREDVPKEEVERQKEAFKKVAADKPPQIQEKIIQGKLESFYKEKCLLDQPFIKDDTQTIKDVINICVAKVGENIRVRRFTRFEVGQ